MSTKIGGKNLKCMSWLSSEALLRCVLADPLLKPVAHVSASKEATQLRMKFMYAQYLGDQSITNRPLS